MRATLVGTTSLVTGASSGIGEATVRRLAEMGSRVVCVARRRDRLEQLVADVRHKGGAADVFVADVSERHEAEAAVNYAAADNGVLDIVVNNAGVMYLGTVSAGNLDDWDRMVRVNSLGMMYVAHAALPHLLAAAERSPRKVADLINVGSVAGRKAYPINAAYASTKFGIAGFTEALRQEVTKRHVRVCLVEPGSVATELASHNSTEVQEQILKPFFVDNEVLVPDDIADAIAFIVDRPRRAAIFDLWISPTEQE